MKHFIFVFAIVLWFKSAPALDLGPEIFGLDGQKTDGSRLASELAKRNGFLSPTRWKKALDRSIKTNKNNFARLKASVLTRTLPNYTKYNWAFDDLQLMVFEKLAKKDVDRAIENRVLHKTLSDLVRKLENHGNFNGNALKNLKKLPIEKQREAISDAIDQSYRGRSAKKRLRRFITNTAKKHFKQLMKEKGYKSLSDAYRSVGKQRLETFKIGSWDIDVNFPNSDISIKQFLASKDFANKCATAMKNYCSREARSRRERTCKAKATSLADYGFTDSYIAVNKRHLPKKKENPNETDRAGILDFLQVAHALKSNFNRPNALGWTCATALTAARDHLCRQPENQGAAGCIGQDGKPIKTKEAKMYRSLQFQIAWVSRSLEVCHGRKGKGVTFQDMLKVNKTHCIAQSYRSPFRKKRPKRHLK